VPKILCSVLYELLLTASVVVTFCMRPSSQEICLKPSLTTH